MTQPDEITQRSKNNEGPQASKLLGSGIKTWWLLLMLPIEDYLLKIKIHPNILTISTLVVGVITGLAYHYGLIFVGGILVLGGSTFDIFDGEFYSQETTVFVTVTPGAPTSYPSMLP